jgi:hypothetical protein
MGSFMQDIAYLGSLQAVGSTGSNKNARIYAMPHCDIPCKPGLITEGKCVAIPMTIMEINSNSKGFGVAPYSMPKPGQRAPPPSDGEKPLPLFETVHHTDGSPPSMNVWSYISKGMNRGKRVDGIATEEDPSPPMFQLAVGNTFVYFINHLTFQSANPTEETTTLPSDGTDFIKAFSIVELLVAPRHSESCLSGRGINVKRIRPSTFNIDAILQKGVENVGLPFTSEEASRLSIKRKALYPALEKDLETEKCIFILKGEHLTKAYISDDPLEETDQDRNNDDEANAVAKKSEFVKISIGNVATAPMCDYIEVENTLLMKQTNTIANKHAHGFLDVAFALGAVDMVVCYDPRWANKGSCYRGVPVINTDKMFAVLKNIRSVEGDHVMVYTGKTDDYGDVIEKVYMHESGNHGSTGVCKMVTLKTDVAFDDGFLTLTVNTLEEDTFKSRSYKAQKKNPALSVVGLGVGSAKCYDFAYGVVCNDPANNVACVMHGFMNREVASSGGIGKKRKSGNMEL